ncbi:glycoside hydrolase family 16 protein [Psychroserpens sp.]|uniref:glycoside hydrolase family 16 protein n=1 Tax=Psychroserpens sp. TaxID=2020870 RepID=UPI001B0C1DC3|nr:glycoside hydrolase family 16 protein [Psychroserpens sp.]MBO6607380.1 glycoside hydrolase family 16 protein [Psychroserpens sp.]MBO6631261.1 glycoside hydrolase family 16 protein [Psychroserpens sp.]MBO6654542.1 glycoside hydrolase family 16 protein [Psychroserpens sp.]MBO6681109.1 glycoside hydrolase family 16 protein [Psychroserpens sp.]MBO6749934.1 glycoside hydrolase family 16 protein [Psychroserpens sp.]
MNKKRKFKITGAAIAAALFFTVSVVSFTGCENDETQTVATLTNVTLAQEFDVDGPLDSAIWSFDIGDGSAEGIPGWGNNELQYYTDRPENVRIEDGVLKITAIQEQFEGSGYTSGRIVTKAKFEQKYGRFEARMKLPWGQGMWPAFWLLGSNREAVADNDPNTLVWPFCGEIDIMENRGQEPTLMNGTIHGPGYAGGDAITKAHELENERFDTDFHIFGIEWGPGYINFYVDDVLYNQLTPADLPTGPEPEFLDEFLPGAEYDNLWNTWVYDQEFYIIINLAVGGNYPGPPNENTVFPQTLEVDYVRVYQ